MYLYGVKYIPDIFLLDGKDQQSIKVKNRKEFT